MPLKDPANPVKRGRGRPRKNPDQPKVVKDPATTKPRKKREKKPPKEAPKDAEEEHDIGSQQQSSQILRRKNRLNDILSTSQGADEEYAVSSKKARPRQSRHSFEEDEGFVYKRSQTDEAARKKKIISTPIAQLNEEIGNISRDVDNDEDMHLLDLQRVRRKNNSTNNNYLDRASRPMKAHNFLDESSLQLSSPIKSDYPRNYSSDDYVEQVSHHKLTLTDSGPRRNRDHPKSTTNRRSSYYSRGKRVSSIGNGFEGEPHRDVPVADYYKLLDTSLPEPDRMRQLLVWCFKKKLEQEDKESAHQSNTEDQTVINIAKVIKEEILRDLMEKQVSTSWYSNHSNVEELTGKEVTVPNPLNITNSENIKIYSEKLKGLSKERIQWQESYEKAIAPIQNLASLTNEKNSVEELQAYLSSKEGSKSYSESILNEQLISKISTSRDDINNKVSADLESSVDKLYHTTYQLEKTSELVGTLQKTKLNEKVTALLRDYVNKTRIEKYNQLRRQGQKSFWPLPTRRISTRELLRSISRIEKRNQ